MTCSFYHPRNLHKISSQYVHNVAARQADRKKDKQVDKQSDKQTNTSKNITSFAKEAMRTIDIHSECVGQSPTQRSRDICVSLQIC